LNIFLCEEIFDPTRGIARVTYLVCSRCWHGSEGEGGGCDGGNDSDDGEGG